MMFIYLICCLLLASVDPAIGDKQPVYICPKILLERMTNILTQFLVGEEIFDSLATSQILVTQIR